MNISKVRRNSRTPVLPRARAHFYLTYLYIASDVTAFSLARCNDFILPTEILVRGLIVRSAPDEVEEGGWRFRIRGPKKHQLHQL